MTADLSLKNQFLLAMPGLAGSYFGDSYDFCDSQYDLSCDSAPVPEGDKGYGYGDDRY